MIAVHAVNAIRPTTISMYSPKIGYISDYIWFGPRDKWSQTSIGKPHSQYLGALNTYLFALN